MLVLSEESYDPDVISRQANLTKLQAELVFKICSDFGYERDTGTACDISGTNYIYICTLKTGRHLEVSQRFLANFSFPV